MFSKLIPMPNEKQPEPRHQKREIIKSLFMKLVIYNYTSIRRMV